MANSSADPRVYLAAERTMLAWLRTGIAVMAFGFVVARFGLFLRLLQTQGGSAAGHGVSPYLGAGLVLVGVVATAGGAVQYRRFVASLDELPAVAGPRFLLGLSWGVALIGLVLTFVLLI